MQHRKGPNMNGPFGLLQSLADGMKLMFKEDFTPNAADKVVFMLAPFVVAIPAITAFAVIPIAGEVRVPFTDITTPLQVTDLPVSVLFIVAIASIGVYGIVLAGWSSGSTYALLGALRSSAQVISYEVAMGLALVAVFLYAGSLSTSEIVAAAGRADVAVFGHEHPALVRRPAAPVVRDLPDLDGRGDQPGPVRPARGRGRAGRRLPHRVLLDALRHVLHGRVHEHDHGLGAGHHAVPRRLPRAAAVQPDPGRWTPATGASSGSCSRCWSAVHLRLAARHPAPAALRPVHALRLEVADPDLAGLDRAGRDPAPGSRARAGSAGTGFWVAAVVVVVVLLALTFFGGREEPTS